jgi:Tol biopolymer transport system component
MKATRNISAILLLLALVATTKYSFNLLTMRQTQLKLKGYIEVVEDFGIKKIAFPSGRAEWIIKKHDDYLVTSFDLSSAGSHRIVEFSTIGDNPTKLVSITGRDEMKTVISKNFSKYPSFSPDGNSIAYLYCPYSRESKVLNTDDCYLFNTRLEAPVDKRISERRLVPFKPSWFADGKRLLVTSRDFNIYSINTETGEEKKIIDFGVAPAISHDGKKIAYLSNEVDETTKKRIIDYYNISRAEYDAIITEEGVRQKELIELDQYFLTHVIYVYDVDTGVKKKISNAEWIEAPPIWSPDDKFLLYNDRSDVANKIFVINVATGEIQKVTNETGRIMAWR